MICVQVYWSRQRFRRSHDDIYIWSLQLGELIEDDLLQVSHWEDESDKGRDQDDCGDSNLERELFLGLSGPDTP